MGEKKPRLSVITVVYNDWPGLERTLASLRQHRGPDLEHWIIDGSDDGEVSRGLMGALPEYTHLFSEPDEGLYDAMNKGLGLAKGDYVLFLNAGDRLHPEFSFASFWEWAAGRTEVLFGYSIERWKQSSYLRPGVGREGDILSMPAHQATFYPRDFYAQRRYRLDLPVSADGAFTAEAVRLKGAVFVPCLVCEFELGGRSTRYDVPSVKLRLREPLSVKALGKLLVKVILWNLLSPSVFYRLMARGKFTPLSDGIPALPSSTLSVGGRPVDRDSAGVPLNATPD